MLTYDLGALELRQLELMCIWLMARNLQYLCMAAGTQCYSCMAAGTQSTRLWLLALSLLVYGCWHVVNLGMAADTQCCSCIAAGTQCYLCMAAGTKYYLRLLVRSTTHDC